MSYNACKALFTKDKVAIHLFIRWYVERTAGFINNLHVTPPEVGTGDVLLLWRPVRVRNVHMKIASFPDPSFDMLRYLPFFPSPHT